MIGIGIDTGGTYTDAVIYDFEKKEVLSSGKALTTKKDLTIGIRNALNTLSDEVLKQAEFLSLSTTLATNACVEGIGGRVKLVFIGVEEKTVQEFHQSYGLPKPEEICFLPKPVTDWEAFREEVRASFAEYDSVAIVEIFAREDQGKYEKDAEKIIHETLDIPCVLGNDLFHELNVLRRGAGVYLNAQLIPVIRCFLKAIQEVLSEKKMELPIVVVRSDGSLMSLEYTLSHPVDTLLCGPASSIIAGTELVHPKDALVVDMGGTTTDVAIVRDHLPLTVEKGINIGDYKTFVKGLYVDTFGLGGDSAIRFKDRHIYLDTTRVIPLCHLAAEYPSVLTDLKELLAAYPEGHIFGLHEFFVLLHDIEESPGFTEAEKAFCRALKEKPLIYEKAARAVGRDVYNFRVAERLEKEGIVMRAGLTPTDIMHLKGDFHRYEAEASRSGSRFVSACIDMGVQELCENAYTLIKKKLYCNLARILLKYEKPFYEQHEKEPLFLQFLEDCFESAAKREGFGKLALTTDAVLIGIGAPVHIFLQDVAEMLGTNAVIPEHAPVANALGAALGNVQVTFPVEIKPVYDGGGVACYKVYGPDGILEFEEIEEAREAAIIQARKGAELRIRERGAQEFVTEYEVQTNAALIEDNELFLEEFVIGKAKGKIS